MERSPRSAAVPRTGASMGQCHTLRSIVISLAIAIALFKSPASGFTIARDLLTPDLETGESKQLEVRHDLKTLQNNETIYNNTKDALNSTVIAINNINENKQNYNNDKATEKQLIVNEITDIQPKISENNKIEIPSDTATTSPTGTTNNAFDSTLTSTSQTITIAGNASSTTLSSTIQTTSSEAAHQELLTTSSTPTSLATKSENESSTVKIKVENNENTTTKDNNIITTTTTDIITTTIPATNTSSDINNDDAGKSDDKTNNFSTDINQPETTKNDLEHGEITTIDGSESKFTTETVSSQQKTDQTNMKEESAIAKTESSLDTYTTVPSESKTETTLENFTAEVYTIDMDMSKLPSWKKYTTIDRKRTSAEDTTTTEKDMAQAETAQTRISLEKVFTNTPIPSLEKLRNDFINAQESTTRPLETTTWIENNTSNASNFETNTSMIKMGTEVETEPTKIEIVSKRAGFKDNRITESPRLEEATTTKYSPTVRTNIKDMYSNMYETGASDVEEPKNKNGSVYESQSQLDEDAIKEELLKEETLNDNADNAQFLKKEKTNDGAPDTATADTLKVKPIGQEKKKNTILYAVNPNYKPLKKIDVQPLKQFVRDPDDNSWRNESISSLGIVFKPKNASKSFTEVLKNKTETELGNMTDKNGKDDLPDLRVRLEKIAEVRKSKKKINKFGDTVYSDYEESTENTNISREDTTTSTMERPTLESTFNFTPPPPTIQSPTTEFDLTLNAISKHFDLFETEKTSPFTTNTYKPKKFYNLAEYYDSTDEYDADYVNQHKIDLKKFTKAMKIKEDIATRPPELLRTQPPELLSTKPMTEYQPERKATLQFFPPTTKVAQRVNLNDYDTTFNRKVNLYDINKASPKNVLAVSFGTVSPPPTAKYEPMNKGTMKPAYTPMYQRENLDKNLYLTNQPRVSELPPHDGTFNRASYVIKHYRDFISEAAQGGDDDRSEEYTYTEAPIRGVTVNELAKMTQRDSNPGEEDYEYDNKFRKDIMNRFVDNFNQNSERFKVDFPVLYNSSVVHRSPENGRVASSSAFMKRLYEVGGSRPANLLRRPCDPQCDKTVELSPAYELHYYVPDEEEKEQIEPRPVSPAYRFRI
ncbi:hypothetical protein PYW08_004146 [Mythimna loreyi]|uniref:Uncharacterized protein n=1 Tax=Mythimna loreyi TaxID=667449 RepID=A0ACC2QVN1_9NEOP|nr:hypothetical protein PYW08_004146 [Mythimna loreyi]